MVVIRLARGGAKKRPFYQIVAADKRSPRDGRNIEKFGYYNPVARGAETELYIDLDRVEYWKSVGAKPSDRVNFLLKKYKKQLVMQEETSKQIAEDQTQQVAATQQTTAEATDKTEAEAKAKEEVVNTETNQQEVESTEEEKS